MRRSTLGPVFSEAARRWWIEMQARGEGFEDVRRTLSQGKVKIGKGMVPRWMLGDRHPDVTSAALIESFYPTVVARLWADPPTVPFELPKEDKAAA